MLNLPVNVGGVKVSIWGVLSVSSFSLGVASEQPVKKPINRNAERQ
jgi:hypothetical protein